MKSKNYYISIDGRRVPVSREVYEAYYKMERRFRYYEHDIKVGRLAKTKNGKTDYLPSKEDSYERLLEAGAEPVREENTVLDAVVEKAMRQKLAAALQDLSPEELTLLFEIFWNGKTERELSRLTGIPQKTINDRKHRILKRLKKAMEETDG